MNNTADEVSKPQSGSIAVYQRLVPGKRPARVEILRAVYEAYRAPDGTTFGRTKNTVLLRVASGTDCLSAAQTESLGRCGLDGTQIARVNQRLSELAAPARERELEMDVAEAKQKLDWILELSRANVLATKPVHDIVLTAARRLGISEDKAGNHLEPTASCPNESLKNVLASINGACDMAKALYKLLPKGELSEDVILEFQKTWFSYQDLLSTLTVRKALARPSGWSKLRGQICAGVVYRRPDGGDAS